MLGVNVKLKKPLCDLKPEERLHRVNVFLLIQRIFVGTEKEMRYYSHSVMGKPSIDVLPMCQVKPTWLGENRCAKLGETTQGLLGLFF